MRLIFVSAALALFAGALASGDAAAWTLDTLHKFCKQSGCPDGSGPVAALVMADKRHFFGTASGGGANANGDHGGVVYELIHNTDGSWNYKVIYSFCAVANCADGDQPLSDLIVDKDGHLYGTTWWGGAHGEGSVFQLRQSGSGWAETVIYSFCSVFTNGKCTDGQELAAGLTYAGQATGAPWDEFSPLYGTTANGGNYDHGTVFQLVSDGSLWNHTVLHHFNTSRYPSGGMVMDSAGNLYGATGDGAANGGGLFFKLAHNTWHETILHTFCSQPNCADGGGMNSRPVIDASSNIYGTTWSGGDGGGVVFEFVHGSGGYTYKVIYSFPSPYSRGNTGTGLAIDSAGDLYGAAAGGGANYEGALFRLHNGANGWKESVLYSFCSQSGCTDGSDAIEAPILDAHGDLFGITFLGGSATSNAGTVFKLTP